MLPRLRRRVDWRRGLTIGVSGAVSAFAGTAVNRLLDQNVLLLIFAGIMVIAGVRMLLPTQSPNRLSPSSPQTHRPLLAAPKAIGTGLGVGFLAGLLGGGGFLIVPALVIVLEVEMSIASGRVGHCISDRILQRGFAALVLLIAAFVAVKAIMSIA